jgi:hypothetical protein
MSEKDKARMLAAAHQDERNRVRAHEKHEAEVRRLVNERWWRRIQPLLPSVEPVEDEQFPGCWF